MADPPVACDLSNGYAFTADQFAQEAQACAATQAARADIEAGVRALSDRARAKLGLDPLARRDGLDAAARAHALDMAARGYLSHEDPEGRGHLVRVRTLDRSVLIGAAGANIAAAKEGGAPALFYALTADRANRENLARPVFTHLGVGAAEDANGQVYVVQVFAQVDGALDRPLPATAPVVADLQARFADAGFRSVGWELVDDEGRVLDQGLGRSGRLDLAAGATASVFIKATRDGDEVYAFRGPRVTAR